MNNDFYSSPIGSPLRSSNVHRLHRMHRRSFAVTSISIGVVFGVLMSFSQENPTPTGSSR